MSLNGMKTLALTGPAGAGKSAASRMLARLGAAVVDGDRLGHEILGWPDVQGEIVQRLGPGYVAEGTVDRAALGARVFADGEALEVLNEIMHQRLSDLAVKKLGELAAEGNHGLAVLEAAVYFLLPSPPPVDLVVAVVATPEIRVARLVERSTGGMTEQAARDRVDAQSSWERFWPAADEIIVNDGSLAELEHRIQDLVLQFVPGSETQS